MSQVLTTELPKRWTAMQRRKNTLIYVSVRAAHAVMILLPFWFVRSVAVWISYVAWAVATKERRLAEQNVVSALGRDFSEKECKHIVRGMFKHLAISAAEMVHLNRFLRGKHAVQLDTNSKAVLDGALKKGSGVLVVAGHMGNWELMAQVIAHAGYPISSIASPLYDPRLTRWIDEIRTAFGQNILWRGDPGISKEILHVLKKNQLLGMLIDQDTRVQGCLVPFFGRLAYTPTAPAALALRAGSAIVLARAWRKPNGDHALEFVDLDVPKEITKEEAVLALTTKFNEWLEQAVRMHPKQWVWLHDRWKRAPASTSVEAEHNKGEDTA